MTAPPLSPAHGLPGLLLAFEGIDGAGKTTQLHALAALLRAEGRPVLTTKQPTDGPWGRKIRAAAASGERLPIEDELHAFLEDRKLHVREMIRPALEQGTAVLIDRYYFSTIAYQGARGLDPVALQAQNEAIAPLPDATLLFEIDVDTALSRVAGRGAADAFERRDSLEAVAAVFAKITCPSITRIRGIGAPNNVENALHNAIFTPNSHAVRWRNRG